MHPGRRRDRRVKRTPTELKLERTNGSSRANSILIARCMPPPLDWRYTHRFFCRCYRDLIWFYSRHWQPGCRTQMGDRPRQGPISASIARPFRPCCNRNLIGKIRPHMVNRRTIYSHIVLIEILQNQSIDMKPLEQDLAGPARGQDFNQCARGQVIRLYPLA